MLSTVKLVLGHAHEVPQSICHHNDRVFVQMKSGRFLQYIIQADGQLEQDFHVDIHVGSNTFMRTTISDSLCLVPAVEGDGSVLELFDPANWSVEGPQVRSMTPSTGMCMCSQLVVSDAHRVAITGYDNGSISIFIMDDGNTNFIEKENVQLFTEAVLCMTCRVEPGGLLKIVCGGAGKFVKMLLFDFETMTVKNIISTELEREGIASLSMDGQLIVCGGWDTNLSIFSSATLSRLTSLSGHSDGISQVGIYYFERGVQSSLRPSLRHTSMIISAGRDGLIRLWSLPDSAMKQKIICNKD